MQSGVWQCPSAQRSSRRDQMSGTSKQLVDQIPPSAQRSSAPDSAVVGGGVDGHRRSGRRVLRHEWTVSCLASVLLAIAMTWLVPPFAVWALSAGDARPTIADARYTLVGDIADPAAQAWTMAWTGHAIR